MISAGANSAFGADIDGQTVLVSETNSHLGHLLLEGDFEDCLSYLQSSEGRDDVLGQKNDPLNLNKATGIPRGTALFAALFVRATYDVLAKIQEIDPTRFETTDLMYALSVVPSEEEERLANGRSSPYRTRTWTSDEYRKVLHLMIHTYVAHDSQSASSRHARKSLVDVAPNWIIQSALTPLSLAAYNPDVSASTLRLISTLEPRALNKTCALFGVQSLPLLIAASSPLPDEVDSRCAYMKARDVRWKKVNALTLSEDFYSRQQKGILESVGSASVDALQTCIIDESPPSLKDIQRSCEVAIKFGEYELVREFVKQADPNDLRDAREAVAFHDAKRKKKQKRLARVQWLHNNAGLLMYPVDALLDLFSLIVPRGKDGPCLVRPMS
mmetsp:Transcript_31031/g.73995  ORF Transcript_31031/g.73995 Transcript_31031/m.73995 type:complete len:385 (+) Transcript_31031:125-1279(+)